MFKKTISIILVFLLLVSSIYIPAFASDESDGITYKPEYDRIEYQPDVSTVLFEENFDNGTAGENVAGFSHQPLKVKNEADTIKDVYASLTYEEGVGGNETKVGKLYDWAYIGDYTRYNLDGTKDTNAKKVDYTTRNSDSFITDDVLVGSKHVKTSFKFYNAGASKKNGVEDGYFIVMHAKPSGVISSTTPQLKIYADHAELNFKDEDDTKTREEHKIYGLEPGKWYDVTFESIYDSTNKKATSILTIGDKYVTSYITRSESPEYDEPIKLSIQSHYLTGGLYYIDDLKVTSVEKGLSAKFKNDVKNMTFDNHATDGSYNSQSNVYDYWINGLPNEFIYDGTSYNVEWTSCAPETISVDGNVTRRAYDQVVTLIAKIFDSNGMYIKRYYDVLVSKKENATENHVLNEYAQYGIKASKYSSEVTENSNRITKKLNLPTEDKIAGVNISWSASHPEIIDVNTGEITRPDYNSDDVVVTLTATISIEGYAASVTKDIQYTVVKMQNPTNIIADAMENLVITDESFGKITKDINLPSSYGETSITWDTSAHSQIDENGVVTRGNDEVTATITGTFTSQGVSLTKDYTLTVWPTVERMIEIDIDIIDKTGWDSITGNFTVPIIGEKYSSILSWESDHHGVSVGNEGKITVRRPSNSATSDLTVNLIVSGKLDDVEKEKVIQITVLRQASDSVVADETADKINFELIKGTGNTMDAVVNDLVLPTGFSYDSGIKIEWTSSHPEIISTNGSVTRPIGNDDVTVTLIANVIKELTNASYSPSVTVTVKAISDRDEIVQMIENDLVFSKLSSEEIDEVTQDLELPNVGKYGADISWRSNSDLIKVEGTKGIVTRPSVGASGDVILTATITYTDGLNSTSVEKQFYITIPVDVNKAVVNKMLSENFNSWSESYKFGDKTSTGAWTYSELSKCGSVFGVGSDEAYKLDGAYVYISHNNLSKDPGSLSYISTDASSANVYDVGFNFYVPSDFSGDATIEIISVAKDTKQYTAVYLKLLGEGSKIELTTTEDKVLSVTGNFNKGEWNKLVFDVDKKVKRYNVYLNEVCITQDGNVKYKQTGESYDSREGVQFTNSLADNFKILRMSAIGGTMYIDNMNVKESFTYSQDQLRAAELWEEQLYEIIDPTCVKDDFNLPSVRVPGIKIAAKTNDKQLMYQAQGTKMIYNSDNVTSPTKILIIVTFDDGNSVLTKQVPIILYPKEKDTIENADNNALAEADLKTAVDFIEGYNLTNLKSNINIANITVKNGSEMTYRSSNQSIITDSGEITRTNSLQQVTFTVTAKKGDVTKSQVLEITVGTKSPVYDGGSGGTGGSGGGGGAPVYGGNANGNTGLDVNQPSEDDNSAQNQISKFTDVTKDHWAYDHITFMVENKIMNGVGDGRMEPERAVNREEFVKMLVVALDLDLKDAAADFADVDKDEWYAPYVATIKAKGLINGFEDGTFGIGQNISRQDLAVLIYRSSDLAKETVEEEFTDDAEIADYAKDAVYTLRKLGVINGKEDGGFDPSAPASRAETATMLYKAIKAEVFK